MGAHQPGQLLGCLLPGRTQGEAQGIPARTAEEMPSPALPSGWASGGGLSPLVLPCLAGLPCTPQGTAGWVEGPSGVSAPTEVLPSWEEI